MRLEDSVVESEEERRARGEQGERPTCRTNIINLIFDNLTKQPRLTEKG